MGTKKIIKLLMAEGVQRNDAAAFVRAYNKVKHKKVIREFPELILPRPVVPIHSETMQPVTYAVQRVVSKREMESDAIDWDRYITDKLANQLAAGILRSGMILLERKGVANDVIFTAKLRILPPEALPSSDLAHARPPSPRGRLGALSPEEKEIYTLGKWGNAPDPTK